MAGYNELVALTSDQAQGDQPAPSYLVSSEGGKLVGDGEVFAIDGPSARSMASSIVSRVFVHFFSGYRREGDLQHQIDNHVVAGRLHIFCISIDICLAKAFSDLTEPESMQWWKARLLSGQVIGIGGGPSCETCSAVAWWSDSHSEFHRTMGAPGIDV